MPSGKRRCECKREGAMTADPTGSSEVLPVSAPYAAAARLNLAPATLRESLLASPPSLPGPPCGGAGPRRRQAQGALRDSYRQAEEELHRGSRRPKTVEERLMGDPPPGVRWARPNGLLRIVPTGGEIHAESKLPPGANPGRPW